MFSRVAGLYNMVLHVSLFLRRRGWVWLGSGIRLHGTHGTLCRATPKTP